MTIKEADGSDGSSASVGFKDKLKTVPKLDHTQKLKVSFSPLGSGGKAIQPEQALLRLTSVVSGKTAFFTAGKLKGDKLEIIASSSGIEDQMGTQGGAFDTLLIIGSSNPAAAIQWGFGQVEILHRPTPDGNQPSAPSARLESAIEVKPEIVHQHRIPEKRTPAIVSLVFTAFIFVPLAAFVLAAINLGAMPTAFPKTGSARLYALGFHGSIAAILVLYIMFWLGLNLMHTFPIAFILEIIIFVFGTKASAAAAEGGAQKITKQE